jgi:hypothetical protein
MNFFQLLRSRGDKCVSTSSSLFFLSNQSRAYREWNSEFFASNEGRLRKFVPRVINFHPRKKKSAMCDDIKEYRIFLLFIVFNSFVSPPPRLRLFSRILRQTVCYEARQRIYKRMLRISVRAAEKRDQSA